MSTVEILNVQVAHPSPWFQSDFVGAVVHLDLPSAFLELPDAIPTSVRRSKAIAQFIVEHRR